MSNSKLNVDDKRLADTQFEGELKSKSPKRNSYKAKGEEGYHQPRRT